ncbi:hypothetical protein [Streptomyces sp. SPB074]|uniref:hypothetical protein n=1 Tax=Streptomyces sp. (strain SPB074) TaxID=465543 RepID=UPI00017F1E7E|nr:hypothetical protein [Streptomyces sp. SPB074]EDY43411.1 hypothetical protein SSBG_01373 [Streptomyces sp. SPB074]
MSTMTQPLRDGRVQARVDDGSHPLVKPLSARGPQAVPGEPETVTSPKELGIPVVGYLRQVKGDGWEDGERALREAADTRGYHLVDIVRSTGVSTLTSGCPGIMQILGQVDRGEVQGVLTLATTTIAWDHEVVRRIAARICSRTAFLDFVWGAAAFSPPRRPEGAR